MQSTCTITIHIMCMTVADISAKVNVVLKKVEAVGQPRARQLLHPSLPYTGDFHFLSVKQEVCYEFEWSFCIYVLSSNERLLKHRKMKIEK